MAGEAQVSVLIPFEDIVKHLLGAEVLCRLNFGVYARPQLVILCEPVLEAVAGIAGLDPAPRRTPVASVLAHTLTETFLDDGSKPMTLGKVDSGKGEFRRLEAASHWRTVVRLQSWDLLIPNSRNPVRISLLGLCYTFLGHWRIGIDER